MSSEHVEVLRKMKGWRMPPIDGSAYNAALDAAIAALSAPQPPAEAHCTTCSCVPGMTPAVRFDTTPAEKEGAVRDHLVRMGWTPPAEAQAQGGGEVVERVAIALHRAYNTMLVASDFVDGWPGWQGPTQEEREFFLRHAREAVSAPPSAATPLSREHGSVQEMFNPSAPVGVECAPIRYFAYDSDCGDYNEFDTLPEAIADAQEALDYAGDDGWPEGGPSIYYGAVLGEAREVEGSRRPAGPGDHPDADFIVEYELKGSDALAQQPAAVEQPVAWIMQDKDSGEFWPESFVLGSEPTEDEPDDAEWMPLFLRPPPSAPVGVEGAEKLSRQHSILLNNVLWRMQVALGDVDAGETEAVCNPGQVVERFFALAQQPAAKPYTCDFCGSDYTTRACCAACYDYLRAFDCKNGPPLEQPAAVDGAMVERIAALLHEEATDEPWTVAGVEHDGPDRDYYRTLARKVIVRAGQQTTAPTWIGIDWAEGQKPATVDGAIDAALRFLGGLQAVGNAKAGEIARGLRALAAQQGGES